MPPKGHKGHNMRRPTNRQIEAFRLCILQGLTQRQAGEQMGIRQQTVCELLQKAMAYVNTKGYCDVGEARVVAKVVQYRDRDETHIARKW